MNHIIVSAQIYTHYASTDGTTACDISIVGVIAGKK